EMVIGFSAPFLIEIFNTLSTENVVVKLADPSRPGVFLPDENGENSELLMLLMPMTVGEF
ncbi:MAG: DNA polymerase III subunit beta, partial [Muribaculaceae bacterium]|nr:DNA polymerase III subunit beta [Muribaculaceae bacterium]